MKKLRRPLGRPLGRMIHRLSRAVPALLLSAALAAGSLNMSAFAAAGFKDVPEGQWYTAAVREMVNRHIMTGKSANTFEPNSPLTRAEFATMLAKTALSESELKKYSYKGEFSDVGTGHWANPFINWASENGVVSGTGNGKFGPGSRITRQDMAVMLTNYARAMGISLPDAGFPGTFKDSGKISGYARNSVALCGRAGVLKGDSSGFRPNDNSRRCEAAQMLLNFLNVGRPPKYTVIRKRVADVSVAAVEFDPKKYTADVVLGHDRIASGEDIQSIIDRTGAEIAVNSIFFNMSSYEPYGTIVKNGKILTIFNDYAPAKSAIVMDGSGRFSVENFTTNVTLTYTAADGVQRTSKKTVVNRYPVEKDSSRIIFTREWGGKLGFKAKYAARVDGSGKVTAVFRDADVDIPAEGYLLVQRAERWQDDGFLPQMARGDRVDMDVEYQGSSTQDIKLCIAVGPKLVQGGRAYGDSGTYQAEGLGGINNYGSERRVCIGVKPDGKLVILTAYTSLPKLSEILVSLGCQSAVNMDGGGSSNLYAGGAYFTGPRSRPMNTVLVFK